MEFFKCSIGGEVYGNGVTEIERGIAEREGMKIEVVQIILWMIEQLVKETVIIKCKLFPTGK